MPVLTGHAYGKAGIRLAKVERDGERHTFTDLTVRVRLTGDFAAAYTAGDNSTSLPTDTMRNTVYALAADRSVAEAEQFCAAVGARLLAVTPAADVVEVSAELHGWDRLADHPHAFRRAAADGTAAVAVPRAGAPVVRSGVRGLTLVKTAGSAFRGFLVDDLTTLAPTDDRVLATEVAAEWTWLRPPPSYAAARDRAVAAIEETFATAFSPSVQATVHDLAGAVLAAVPEAAAVTFRLPNRHHVPVDLSPFGRDHANEVFTVLAEPSGVIEGTVARAAETNREAP